MHSDAARFPAPSGRFLLLPLVVGGVVGLSLLALEAPFWLFYIAPVLLVPLVIWELRALDPDGPPVAATGPISIAGEVESEGPRGEEERWYFDPKSWLPRDYLVAAVKVRRYRGINDYRFERAQPEVEEFAWPSTKALLYAGEDLGRRKAGRA